MIRMTLLAMATLAAAATSVAAQESIVALTLADALDLARRQSPALRRAQADMRTASADVRASYGAFLPSLTGTLTFQGSANTTVTGTDDFGRPIDLPEARTFRRSSASQSIGTSVTLFDGFQNLNNLHASQNRAAATRHGVEAEWVRVAAEVSRRFYDAIRTQRLIRVEEQLLQSAEEQLEATTRLFRVGSASQVDVLGAQVDVARQELEVERARGEARKSLLTLKQQIGIDEDIVFSVQGGFPEPIDPSSLNVDELVAEAIRFNPGVSRSRAVEAAARNSLGAAHGRRLPTISGGASFSRNSNLPDYDALFQFDPRDRVWAFNLQIQLPIFNGFGTEQLIAQARTQRTQAEENVREAMQQTDQLVRAAFIDLENAFEGLRIENRSLELSRRQLTLAREQYRLGALNFQGLQTVIDRASQAERAAVTAKYQLAAAVATLKERVGSSSADM